MPWLLHLILPVHSNESCMHRFGHINEYYARQWSLARWKGKPPLETIAVHHPKVILILFCLIFSCDRKELSSKISPRVLISAVTECYHKVVIKQKVRESACLCVKFSKLLWAICERARDKLGLSFFSFRSVWCRLWACLQIVLAAWRRRISKPTSQTYLACFWKCWILECNTTRKYEFQIYILFYMMKVY